MTTSKHGTEEKEVDLATGKDLLCIYVFRGMLSSSSSHMVRRDITMLYMRTILAAAKVR